MAEPYIGEIRLWAAMFCPVGWHYCDGSTINISDNPSLYGLIGTTYGGDGNTTFGLPDMRSRVPVHMGTGAGATYTLAQTGGTETVTLNAQQNAAHNHAFVATNDSGSTSAPAGNVMAQAGIKIYLTNGTPGVSLGNQSITSAGGGQSHPNIQPYQCLAYIIALEGVWPQKP